MGKPKKEKKPQASSKRRDIKDIQADMVAKDRDKHGKAKYQQGKSAGRKQQRDDNRREKEFNAQERKDKRATPNAYHNPSNVVVALPQISESLTSYGMEREDLSLGNLLPKFTDSRSKLIIGTYADQEFWLEKNAMLDAVTEMATYIADAQLGYLVDSSSSPARIKDWVAAQRTAYLELICYGITWLLNLVVQLSKRRVCKLVTENSGTGYWVQEDLDAYLNGLNARNIMLPSICVKIVQALAVVFILEGPLPDKDLPAAIYCPWTTTMDITTARTYRDAIIVRNGPATIHAAKASLPMMRINAELILGLGRVVDITTDEGFVWQQLPFLYSSVANKIMYSGEGATAIGSGSLEVNKTTGYTHLVLCWRGERPHDLYAFLPMLHPFDAVNNPLGMYSLSTPADATYGFGYMAQNAVSITAVPFDPVGYAIDIAYAQEILIFNPTADMVVWDVSATTQYVRYVPRTTSPVFWINGRSYAEMYEWQFRALALMLRGDKASNEVPSIQSE